MSYDHMFHRQRMARRKGFRGGAIQGSNLQVANHPGARRADALMGVTGKRKRSSGPSPHGPAQPGNGGQQLGTDSALRDQPTLPKKSNNALRDVQVLQKRPVLQQEKTTRFSKRRKRVRGFRGLGSDATEPDEESKEEKKNTALGWAGKKADELGDAISNNKKKLMGAAAMGAGAYAAYKNREQIQELIARARARGEAPPAYVAMDEPWVNDWVNEQEINLADLDHDDAELSASDGEDVQLDFPDPDAGVEIKNERKEGQTPEQKQGDQDGKQEFMDEKQGQKPKTTPIEKLSQKDAIARYQAVVLALGPGTPASAEALKTLKKLKSGKKIKDIIKEQGAKHGVMSRLSGLRQNLFKSPAGNN